MKTKSKKHEIVFEGNKYREIKNRLLSIERSYKDLDLNKVLLCDIGPHSQETIDNLIFEKSIYLIKNTFFLCRTLSRIFFFKEVLFTYDEGNVDIWFLKAPSTRPSY